MPGLSLLFISLSSTLSDILNTISLLKGPSYKISAHIPFSLAI